VRRSSTQEILEIQRDIQAKLSGLTTPAPPPPPPPDPNAEYVKTLPEENRELIDLLTWAEGTRPELKGKAAEQVAYLRRLDEFNATNPDEDALAEFQTRNKPQLSDALIRKLNREKLITDAKNEARAEILRETEERLKPVIEKQYEMEMTPHLRKLTDEFVDRFTKPVAPEQAAKRLDPAKAKEIINSNFDQTKFAIEARILHDHRNLAGEFLRLAYGVSKHDQNNRMHQDLSNFLFYTEQQMTALPVKDRVRHGKHWLPATQYNALMAKDAEGTKAKYWAVGTDPEFILERLEGNAQLLITQRYEEIARQAEQLGYQKPGAPAAPPPAAPARPAPAVPAAAQNGQAAQPPAALPAASPRGGVSIAPGAASNAPAPNPNLKFLETIAPGASKLLGLS